MLGSESPTEREKRGYLKGRERCQKSKQSEALVGALEEGDRGKSFSSKKMQMKFSTDILQEPQPSCKNKSLLLVFFSLKGGVGN